jgi:drug/metabolite transporter (DMT)-like permease
VRAVADLALLLLTLAWGTTFTLVKRALDGTSPAVFLSLRFAVATLAVGSVWLWRRDLPTPGLWKHATLLGLAMFAGFALQTLGLRHTTPARSGFLTGLAVLIVPILSHFLVRRRVPPTAWLGVALAVAGLLLLTRPFGDDLPATVRLGDLLTVGCAGAYAFQIIWTSEWSGRHPLALLTLIQVSITLLGATLMMLLEPLQLRPDADLAGTVAFTGIAMTAGAFFVMNWGQRHTTAVRAALIFSLEPVVAALFSHYYGGEPLGAADWAGGALIARGVVAGEVGGALEARREPRSATDVGAAR